MKKAKSLEDTDGAFKLAKTILNKIETFSTPDPIEIPGSGGKSTDDSKVTIEGLGPGEEGEGELTGGDIDVEAIDTEEKSDAKEGGGKGAEKEEEKHSELKKKIRESLEKDIERELPTAGKEISEESKKMHGYRPYSTEKDTFIPHKTRDIEAYNKQADKLKGIATTLRGRLSRILLSQKRSRWTGNKRNGILNPSQLHQVITKTSDSIYRTRKEGIKLDTAVSILIDLSGSMRGLIGITQQTAIVLAETLTKIGVSFEILGFSGDNGSNHGDDTRGFSRWGSLDMFYFKKFEEPYNRVQKERIAGMKAHEQNYDGESLAFAARRLKLRPERKKILFALSDGAPSACYCDHSALVPHLKKVASKLEQDPSIHLIAFG